MSQQVLPTQPTQFLSRVVFGALWGLALNPGPSHSKFEIFAVLACLAFVLSFSFFPTSKLPLTSYRIALYGLLIAGEACSVGAFVLAALGLFSGQVNGLALVITAGLGGSVTQYARAVILYENMLADEDNI